MGKPKIKWHTLDLERIQSRPGQARLEFVYVEAEKEEEEGGEDAHCSFFKKIKPTMREGKLQ